MRQQKIEKPSKQKHTVIMDNRKEVVDTQPVNLAVANRPVRALNFVEVGGMDPKQVHLMVQELAKVHNTAQGGIHYFLAVRNGKIMTDIVFEQEILDFVHKICEIRDGAIVLKHDAQEVDVIRQRIE